MDQHIDLHLSGMSRLTGIDFSKFDLDAPLQSLPQTVINQPSPNGSARPAFNRKDLWQEGGIDFAGTADHVAGMMQEVMEEVGGDGFLFFNSYFDRRYVIEVCDGLVPNCSVGV